MEELYEAFSFLQILLYLDLMFFTSDLMKWWFLRKIGRYYELVRFSVFTNMLTFCTSLVLLLHIHGIRDNVDVEGISEEELYLRKHSKIVDYIDIKFEYFLSVVICCLLLKLMEIVQFG